METYWGCFIERPPIVSYLSSKLMNDSRSELWTVLFTEWAVLAAAHILAEAYDQYRIWYLSLQLRDVNCRLDLRILFESQTNANEVHDLLEFLDHVQWDEVLLENSHRLQPQEALAPGRVARPLWRVSLT